jgi:hypothetical protein
MPLNGSNIHPLSAHARSILDTLTRAPLPTQEVNPGVIRRFLVEQLVEIVQLPSPYKKHKGGKIAHVQITEAGRNEVISGMRP